MSRRLQKRPVFDRSRKRKGNNPDRNELGLLMRALKNYLETVEAPNFHTRPECSFADLARRWVRDVLSQKKPSYQRSVQSSLRVHVLPKFKHRKLHDITAEQVQQFVAGLKGSSSTVRNAVMVLRSILHEACRWGYIKRNPVVGATLPRKSAQPVPSFTLEDMQRIIAAAEEPRRTLYMVAAETGLRAGELFALRVDRLDLQGRVLFVVESVWEGKFQEPKTRGSVRSCDLSLKLTDHLRFYLDHHWREHSHNLLFYSPHGGILRESNFLRREFHPMLRGLGIPPCGLHAFRHGNISLMDWLGTPFKQRILRVGHANERTTLNYTHARSKDGRDVAERCSSVLYQGAPQEGAYEQVVQS